MNIEKVITEVLYIDSKLTDEMGPDDIEAWDSLGHINIISALEEEYDVEITPEEIVSISNIGDIKRLIERKLSA